MVKWIGLHVNGDTGVPFAAPNYATKSVQAVGIWGGATVTIEGSNMVDNPIYSPETNILGASITFSADGVKQIFSNTYYIRPRISSGATDTTLVDVYLICHTER